MGATRRPTDAWVVQQLRETTPFDQRPHSRIHANDRTFGTTFARVSAASGIAILRTPRANAACERFLGRVRRACLDLALVLGGRHLARVLQEYVAYCDRARPHQGLHQALPEPPPAGWTNPTGPLRAVPVRGGLHHPYRRAA